VRRGRRSALALAALLAAGVLHADDKAKPPLVVPLFDGDEQRTHQPPQGALQRPTIPDYRQLFDLVVACWPAKSWFRGDLYLEARASSKSSVGGLAIDPNSGIVSSSGDRSIALVARIPLISATELDKERNREAERRGKIAEAVGNLVSAYSERVMQLRQLKLLQALEKRAQERVRLGVAETAEQVRYLEQVSALETKIQALQSDEIKARLHVVGMCDERSMARIDAYLDTFNQVR
jgi:hypothetical protein